MCSLASDGIDRETMDMELGVIGCGNMGGSMVAHMLESGCNVHCYDPDSKALEGLKTLGAVGHISASDLAAECDVIVLSLPKADAVRAVMTEISSYLQPDSIILDTSTSEPETSKAMSALATAKGFAFVDGPVSGGPSAARSGSMTMLLGGDEDAVDRLKPVIDLLTSKAVVVGGSGAGHAAKIANNMLCAANLVLVAEAIRLGRAAGVEAKDLIEGINAGSGRSGVSEVNFPKWVLNEAYDSGFTMGLMRKDVKLALDLAQSSGVDLEGFEAIARIWLDGSEEISDTADFNEVTTYDGKRAKA
jgi:3-hydroxyisobutyrate dehydrogenase